MKRILFTLILYFAIMQAFSYIYTINFLQAGYFFSVSITFIITFIMIIVGILIYYYNVLINKFEAKNYIILILGSVLPITILFYLPLYYGKEILLGFSIIFPSLTEYLISISYAPIYLLIISSQVICGLISSLFFYFISK